LLRTRLLTAAVLLAGIAAALLWFDRVQISALAAARVALGAREWGRLCALGAVRSVLYAVLCAAVYALVDFGSLPLIAPALWLAAAFWILVAPIWLAKGVGAEARVALLAAGAVVLIPAALAMAELPPRQLLMVLGLVWVADSAAFFAGSALGRHKLAPAISPRKTWEGVAGGAAGSTIYAIIWATVDPQFPVRVQGEIWIPFLAGALLLCALSVMGDLFESALKRQAGAKDSGRLLPGHGGVLDRIDSATATLPAALLMLRAAASS
jgi:phosphatidate cytidylyltransferase